MKLTLMLWTAAAAAAVTVQLLAAASLEMEAKELEDALATRGVEVERRVWDREEEQELVILDALIDGFQALLRYAKTMRRREGNRRRGRGRGRGRGRYYDSMPRKRLLEEGKGGDAQGSVAEQDVVALCRDFVTSQKIGGAAGKDKREEKEQGDDGEQDEIQEEEKQDESQEEMDLNDLVQTQRILELCLEVVR